MVDMNTLLKLTQAKRASDLYLSVGNPPVIRINGELQLTEFPPLTQQSSKTLIYNMLYDEQKAIFERDKELDFSFALPNMDRFRVNIHLQKGNVEAAFRRVPMKIPSIDQLGLPDVVFDFLNRPNGLVLCTGPTGTGKSTTMAAMVEYINTNRSEMIVTIEDPIEFVFTNKKSVIKQREVYSDTHSFPEALKRVLRQDPDVVMVGEIRDIETAQIAVQASLTGHLVLSTLHTNTAAGAITRLEDMGIEPFLLSSSLLAVLSQRLVRTLCPDCKKPHSPDASELEILGQNATSDTTIYKPHGCAACNQTGYRGRTGIHELLLVDEKVREMMHEGVGEQAIERYIRTSTPSIREDGCSKVLAGETSLEEVLRVTRED